MNAVDAFGRLSGPDAEDAVLELTSAPPASCRRSDPSTTGAMA